jgi:hypothetical protein
MPSRRTSLELKPVEDGRPDAAPAYAGASGVLAALIPAGGPTAPSLRH